MFAAACAALLMHGPVHAAEDCVEPTRDPTNTYDAQYTYEKLAPNYPAIRIASAAVPADVRVVADQTYIQYGTHCLKLDMYLPTNAKQDLPVVVFVHGGGWRSGFRSEFVPMALRLARNGYASVTVTYRLAGEAMYPAAVHDVRAAVRWVREHAGEYGLDPRRIALAGGSAGGQIASLAGVTGHMNQFDPGAAISDVSSAVQAVVNIDGLSDFTSEAARVNEDDPKKPVSAAGYWFGGRYAEKAALWREASPIQYVNSSMPPMLFIGSAQPRFAVGREEMVEKMTQLRVPSKVVLLPDTPHSFWLFDPWLQPTVDVTVAFLNAQMPSRQAKRFSRKAE
ncbi:alpha/beta hydrolase [Oxalobacteraceae bacterium OTU3CAMAD1]|nr:alpha/beta hydrolase [Oxalobacteraceae bacterium OTU3CAMAD1]